MKEAFEKIKERLEEETYDMEICEEQFDANSPYFIDVPYKMVKLEDALSIVSEVEAEYMKNPMYQYAMVYAKNLVQFGVDVRENWDSAVAQSMALNQAYIRGIEDERKRIYEAEYGNVKTNADHIRSMNDEELAHFLVDFNNTFGEEYEGEMSCLDWLRSTDN